MKTENEPLTHVLENLDHDNKPTLIHNIEEIKSMREEINWRVKTAYSSSIIFLSIFGFITGTLFQGENKLREELSHNPDLLVKVILGSIILISAWVGVQNANHLIEKRIELYTLDLLKVIHKKHKHVFFGWLGYLYGSKFFKNKVANMISKFLNASIGMFIYLLPNCVGLFIWGYLVNSYSDYISNNLLLFVIATFVLFVSAASSFSFFIFVINLDKKYSDFYKNVMGPYYKNNS